jgi:hypothetical protein
MRVAWRALIVLLAAGLLVAGVITVWKLVHHPLAVPGCTVIAPADQTTGAATASYELTPEQAGFAATIAAVGLQMGMPAHAVTVALATAMQESKLRNLPGGDLDSLGLFQQRPSQGWGTTAQIMDPVYSAGAFYRRLTTIPGWQTLAVTDAAQQVQRSGAPQAYAAWEDEARTAAAALTGQRPAALTCHDLTITPTSADLAGTAQAELGTAAITGAHPADRGWALASWLVAHAVDLGVDQVTFDGRGWSAADGAWASSGAADGMLSLHRATAAPSTS